MFQGLTPIFNIQPSIVDILLGKIFLQPQKTRLSPSDGSPNIAFSLVGTHRVIDTFKFPNENIMMPRS